MPTHEEARRQLEAAQRAVDALALIPDADVYEVGTILRWQQAGSNTWPTVAVKIAHNRWHISGLDSGTFNTWRYIVSAMLSKPLDFFEVAPEDWSDARVRSTPPVEITVSETDGMTLTDTAGHVWDRRGNQWVLR